MNYELLVRLALLHRDEMLRAAACRRALRSRGERRPARLALARAVRAVGYAALTLGDALAPRPS